MLFNPEVFFNHCPIFQILSCQCVWSPCSPSSGPLRSAPSTSVPSSIGIFRPNRLVLSVVAIVVAVAATTILPNVTSTCPDINIVVAVAAANHSTNRKSCCCCLCERDSPIPFTMSSTDALIQWRRGRWGKWRRRGGITAWWASYLSFPFKRQMDNRKR